MEGCLLAPHPVLQFQSLSAFTRPRFGKSVSPIKEIRDRSLVSSIRADGNRGRHKKNPYPGRSPKTEGTDDGNAQSFDGKSSSSPNKEEILALFKRIQSSISKGETLSPKKRTSKAAEDNKPSSSSPSAETILEVLQQSRTQRKGKSVSIKGDEFLDTLKKEESEGEGAPRLSTRLPSRFTRRSPIGSLSSLREELPLENERTPATPTLSIPRDETDDDEEDDSDQQAMNFSEMKLPQLKEVAKSKGIKGYSKLKKSELLDLLIKSSP